MESSHARPCCASVNCRKEWIDSSIESIKAEALEAGCSVLPDSILLQIHSWCGCSVGCAVPDRETVIGSLASHYLLSPMLFSNCDIDLTLIFLIFGKGTYNSVKVPSITVLSHFNKLVFNHGLLNLILGLIAGFKCLIL